MQACRGVVACVVLMLVTPAAAQPGATPPTATTGDGDVELAKRHFKLGEELYNRSDFKNALPEFVKAYELSNKPALLYNIARCHEFMGNLDQAVKTYEAYLATGPDNVAVIERRVANLKQKIAERDKAGRDKAGREKTGRDKQARPSPPPVPRDNGKGLRLTGWILVGAGVAALAAGVALGAVAGGKSDDLEQAAATGQPWRDWQVIHDEGQAMELGQIVGLAVGGALTAAGAVLVYLGYRARGQTERQAWIAPVMTADGALVTGTWRF